MSLRSLARRVGVSGAYLSRVENGHDPAPTPHRLCAIADALELAPEMLVELAQQTAPALTAYIERVPAASAFFLEVARRDLDGAMLARLRDVMDHEFPPASELPGDVSQLSSLIGPRMIHRLECAGIESVIAAGAARCVGETGSRADELARRIRDREEVSPTALGNGMIVPHAIVPGERSAAALVTLAEPLDYPTPDAAPIEVAIVLCSGAAGREHLELLAHVARLASLGVAGALRDAQTPAQAVAVLKRVEAR
jgi:PTS system nitrogen regulatory IIA component